MGNGHVPVLLARCLDLLVPALDRAHPVHVDATVGLGGHAEAVLAAHPAVRLVGLDRDPEALRRSRERLAPYGDRVTLVHAVYDELPDVLARLGLNTVDSVLFDLGVSSMQLDETARGFSYARDAPLDMRMDPTQGITAADVVNSYSAGELTRILQRYGEERFAARIAAAIVRERQRAPLDSSARLAELVRAAVPAPARRTGGHPAKRTFQALRIEVNGELAALESAIPAAIEALSLGGRIVVLSYHSLEDRIVKQALAARARSSAPVDLPFVPAGSGPMLRLLTRGAELPGLDEIEANPRAASAKLRAAERIDPDARRGPVMRGGRKTTAPSTPDVAVTTDRPPTADAPVAGDTPTTKDRPSTPDTPVAGDAPATPATSVMPVTVQHDRLNGGSRTTQATCQGGS
jgi:16S rRNA (cytosine1402-N4)-methyltransferase